MTTEGASKPAPAPAQDPFRALYTNAERLAHEGVLEMTYEAHPDAYKSVGIVGGGTAGYLCALALRARIPELEVVLIESSAIPVIGVGEATVPTILHFLHGHLGIDIVDFWTNVQPTWKHGIKFEWGLPGDYFFQAPFDWNTNTIGILGSYVYEGDVNTASIQTVMMNHDLAPVMDMGNSKYVSFLSRLPFAYHLDNRRLVAYLKKVALERGIKVIDCTIADAAVTPDGEEIEHLITSEGEKLKYDLYVDCSGFRSLLLENKLHSAYINYDSTLFTDRALAFNSPHGGHIKPYTTAKTMDSGWSWIIPMVESDHCGYVFSSSFCSDDQALAEVKMKFPQTSEERIIKFRSGRHAEFWKGNVVAIGNSYGFVEPLESTALLMITEEILSLTQSFPRSKKDTGVRQLMNLYMGYAWDQLRWFLSIHYKFNHKYSTKFWKAAQEETDISGASMAIDLYRDGAPLAFRSARTINMLRSAAAVPFYGISGFDCIMLGQKVPCRLVNIVEERHVWEQRKQTIMMMKPQSMLHAEALRVMYERPELIRQIVTNPHGWVAAELRRPAPPLSTAWG